MANVWGHDLPRCMLFITGHAITTGKDRDKVISCKLWVCFSKGSEFSISQNSQPVLRVTGITPPDWATALQF